jgi:hypothetical protein
MSEVRIPNTVRKVNYDSRSKRITVGNLWEGRGQGWRSAEGTSHVWLEETVPAPHPFPHQQFENLIKKKKKYIGQYRSVISDGRNTVDRGESMLLFTVARLADTGT